MNNEKVKTAATPAKRSRKSYVSLDKKKARAGWLFVLPFVIGLAFIYLPIIIESIQMCFCSYTTYRTGDVSGYTLENVGFANFRYLFKLDNNAEYTTSLISSLKDLVIDIPAIVVFSLFMALLLNQKMVGRTAFRAILFIPVIISTGIISTMDSANALISSSAAISDGTGASATSQIVNATDLSVLFSGWSVGSELVTYVTDIVNDIFNIVNRSGVQILIFLAGLQSISPSVYESCEIEGASAWETFWKITFPMISPMILVNAIYTIIDSFTSADSYIMTHVPRIGTWQDKLVQDGTVNFTAQTIRAAGYWVYFAIIIGVIGIVAAIISAFVFYQRRD